MPTIKQVIKQPFGEDFNMCETWVSDKGRLMQDACSIPFGEEAEVSDTLWAKIKKDYTKAGNPKLKNDIFIVTKE